MRQKISIDFREYDIFKQRETVHVNVYKVYEVRACATLYIYFGIPIEQKEQKTYFVILSVYLVINCSSLFLVLIFMYVYIKCCTCLIVSEYYFRCNNK